MDALKLIAQDSLKAEKPAFEIGDTIRIDTRTGDYMERVKK